MATDSLGKPSSYTVQTTFDTPWGNDPVTLNLSSMGKGEVWINGESIGRYWVSFKSPSGQPTQSLSVVELVLTNNTNSFLELVLTNNTNSFLELAMSNNQCRICLSFLKVPHTTILSEA
jgi:hypothetical protein